MAKNTKEPKENKEEQIDRVLMIEEALEKLTLPVIREAKTPIEALSILSLYVQSMALAIILSNGMPVADNFNVMLKKIADIKNLDHWERVSKEKRKQIETIVRAKAAIVDMNGNPIK